VDPVFLDRENLTFDTDKLVQSARKADVVVICSPNNPTGNVFDREALVAVLKNARGIVLVDEAYHEFSGQTAVPLLSSHPNLVVLRTFSKAMSMAGLRFGYMMAHPEIAREIYKSKLPYNVNIFTLAAAEIILEKHDVLNRGIAALVRERDRVFAELQKRPAIHPFPSKANFILLKTGKPPRELFDALYKQGVLIRDVSAYPLLEQCLRVSIGTPEENDRFLAALDRALENK
jgi:histidinol-phosphate aminotransferase